MRTSAAAILRSTVDDIFQDPRASVVCLVPTLLPLAAIYAAALALAPTLEALGNTTVDVTEQQLAENAPEIAIALLGALVLVVLVVIGGLWTAVAWHRLVVLGEKPGRLLPSWPRGKLLGYFWRGFLVGLLILVAFIPLGMAGALLAPESAMFSDGSATFTLDGTLSDNLEGKNVRNLIAEFVASSILYGLYLCLGLVLPACAIGRPLSIGDAWEATRRDFFRLYVPLGALLAVVEFVFTLVAETVSFGGVFDLIAFGITTLLGIGVLTRLYLARFLDDQLASP